MYIVYRDIMYILWFIDCFINIKEYISKRWTSYFSLKLLQLLDIIKSGFKKMKYLFFFKIVTIAGYLIFFKTHAKYAAETLINILFVVGL